MLSNKLLFFFTISLILSVTQSSQFPRNFFDDFSLGSTNTFFNSMINFERKMLDGFEKNMKEMFSEHEKLKNLTSAELAFKKEFKNESTSFEFGGCDCKNYTCSCCGLIEELSESPVCYQYAFQTSDEKLKILLNEIVVGNVLMNEIKNDVCDDSDNLCLHFYDMKYDNDNVTLSGCSDIKIKSKDIQVKLGCYKMGLGITSYKRNLISIHTQEASEFLNENHRSTNNDLVTMLDKEYFVNFETFKSGFTKSVISLF